MPLHPSRPAPCSGVAQPAAAPSGEGCKAGCCSGSGPVAQYSHDPCGTRVLHEQQAALGRAATGSGESLPTRCNGTAGRRATARPVLLCCNGTVHPLLPVAALAARPADRAAGCSCPRSARAGSGVGRPDGSGLARSAAVPALPGDAALAVQAGLVHGREFGQDGQSTYEPGVQRHGADGPADRHRQVAGLRSVPGELRPDELGKFRGEQLQEQGLGEPAPGEQDAGAVADGRADRRTTVRCTPLACGFPLQGNVVRPLQRLGPRRCSGRGARPARCSPTAVCCSCSRRGCCTALHACCTLSTCGFPLWGNVVRGYSTSERRNAAARLLLPIGHQQRLSLRGEPCSRLWRGCGGGAGQRVCRRPRKRSEVRVYQRLPFWGNDVRVPGAGKSPDTATALHRGVQRRVTRPGGRAGGRPGQEA